MAAIVRKSYGWLRKHRSVVALSLRSIGCNMLTVKWIKSEEKKTTSIGRNTGTKHAKVGKNPIRMLLLLSPNSSTCVHVVSCCIGKRQPVLDSSTGLLLYAGKRWEGRAGGWMEKTGSLPSLCVWEAHHADVPTRVPTCTLRRRDLSNATHTQLLPYFLVRWGPRRPKKSNSNNIVPYLFFPFFLFPTSVESLPSHQ